MYHAKSIKFKIPIFYNNLMLMVCGPGPGSFRLRWSDIAFAAGPDPWPRKPLSVITMCLLEKSFDAYKSAKCLI